MTVLLTLGYYDSICLTAVTGGAYRGITDISLSRSAAPEAQPRTAAAGSRRL
jgi:hypothetical protein